MEMCSFCCFIQSMCAYAARMHATCLRVCLCASSFFALCHPSVPGELRMPLKDGKTAAISVTGSDHWDPYTHTHTHIYVLHTFTHTHTHLETSWKPLPLFPSQHLSGELVILYCIWMPGWVRKEKRGDKIMTAASIATHFLAGSEHMKRGDRRWAGEPKVTHTVLSPLGDGGKVSLFFLLFFFSYPRGSSYSQPHLCQ